MSEKVVEKLEERKLTYQAQQDQQLRKDFLYKLTEQAPVMIYVMEIKPDGKVSFPFVSPSLHRLYPGIIAEMLEKDGSLLFRQVYPEDRANFKADTNESKQNLADWEVKFRVQSADGSFRWHWSKARPEKRADGTLVYYGATMDVTESQEYVQTIENILFDISHELRRPVSTLLGLADMMHDPIVQEDLAGFALHFKTVAEEMDAYIKRLNETYNRKRLEIEKTPAQ